MLVLRHRYVVTQLHKEIEHWRTHGYPPLLVVLGPSGTGKTTVVQHVCALHGDDSYVIIPAVRGARLSDFFGVWVMRDGVTEFVPGPLYTALLQEGCTIVVDDAHTLGPDLQLFNGLGDGTGLISCAEHSVTLRVADGVRLVLIANPPSPDLPSWERAQWEIPEQIISRARVIRQEQGLSTEDEQAILAVAWEDLDLPRLGQPTTVRDGLYEVIQHLRATPALGSYLPSIRDAVMFCHLLVQGLPFGQAFLQSVGYKPSSLEGRVAAVETFQAKFGFDPRDRSSTLFDGGA